MFKKFTIDENPFLAQSRLNPVIFSMVVRFPILAPQIMPSCNSIFCGMPKLLS